MTDNDQDRCRGVLLGLACGDALGRPVEFKSEAAIEREHGRLSTMVGGGTWNKPPGTITDDTDMALCIARSLAERGRFDPEDIAGRFIAWYDGGPFDIGGMTRRSIQHLHDGQPWDAAGEAVWQASPEGQNAGNGSVMRCAPLAVAYADYPAVLVRTSMDSSRITHADPRCTLGCAILNLTIAAVLDDVDQPVETALSVLADDLPTEMHTAMGVVPDGTTSVLEGGVPDVLRDALTGLPEAVEGTTLGTSGYVVTTLQTALYDGLTADSVEEAVVSAVNRGGDTDTIGAIAGAVAGARFGASGIPDEWLSAVEQAEELESLADALARHPHESRPDK